MRKTVALDNLTLIGWQGITLEAPEDWNVGVIGGDRQSGYLRIDDVTMPRVEIKWERAGKASAVNLERTLDKYLRDLTKSLRKRKIEAETHKEARPLSKRRKDKTAMLNFWWKGDQQGYGMIWHCGACSRIVIAQVRGALEERLQPLAARVLNSLEDHAEGGWDAWSVYGLEFEMPEAFTLDKHKLLTGQLELEFTRKGGERIVVSRWGMANLLLKPEEVSLSDWATETIRRKYSKTHRFAAAKPVVMEGHESVRLEGRIKPIRDRVKDAVVRFVLRRQKPIITVLAWHCPHSNKIFATHFFLERQHEFLVNDVTESVVCHE